MKYHIMKHYNALVDRVYTRRYSDWVDEKYDTNYSRFRRIWFPKNKFNIWDITHGSDAYEIQYDRSSTKRREPWEGESALFTFTTYFNEIRKAYSKKKKKEIKSVYKPFRG